MSKKYLDDSGLAYLWTKIKAYVQAQIQAVGALTGVKGNAESTYRTGNVNLTPANIGAVDKTGDTMSGALTMGDRLYMSNNVAIRGYLADGTTTAQIGYVGTDDTVYLGQSAYPTNIRGSDVKANGNDILTIANVDGDVITVSSVAVGYTNYDVTFNKTFSSTPYVVAGLAGTLTVTAVGNVSVACYAVTTTGCTVRIYNNSGAARNITFRYIAIGV